MKKIFYILASAIVALGAVACDNQDLDNIAPEAGSETLSFTAAIDNTKTDLGGENGLQTVWVAGDVVTINGFEFVCGEDLTTFTCTGLTAEQVAELKGADELTAWYNEGGVDSSKGTAGAQLKGVGSFADDKTATFKFEVMSAFLKFTSAVDVKLAGEGLFTNLASSYKGTDVYVAVNVDVPATFSCTVAGETKTKEGFTAKAGKIYNLGEVDLGELSENWGFVGAHQGWSTTDWAKNNTDKLYQVIGTENVFVKRNVKLVNGGFKFYGETYKTITVEHPEVTGGEQGDFFLIPNSNWKQSNARYAIYFFNNSTNKNTWVSMADANKDGIYAANKPTGDWTHMIFCRMNPSASANNWNNKWNQTGDLKIPTDGKNLFTVPSGSWDGSTTSWSVHTVVEHQDAWTEEVVETTPYWVGVKSAEFKLGNWFTVYSDNLDETAPDNITVSDYNKTYDLYLRKGTEEGWGFTIDVAVVEHGKAAPEI